ncbi:hypothetical protein UFOVP240_77 [uncultured Caudovirales phage]|uniref:Oxoglutarate/iron-dependent dioxygenase n=1 Tax=uncultured Caudovirales phage TaxID=2100421 RepID=A0A6J7WTK2_9CAUD|nr:hypothetical protein UFOVP240_77 [uncultured Caudovirales phage]
MNKNFIENNYIVIDNFIEKDKALELYENFAKDAELNPNASYLDAQFLDCFCAYNYKPFLLLLCEKLNEVSTLIEEPLLPTYTFARLYKNGSELIPHVDNARCEVSITLNLYGDKEWPIWFTKPNNEKISVTLKPGQAVVYSGMISEHWRTEYEGEIYAQVFLHYVRVNGDHWLNYFDRMQNGILIK